MNAEEERKAIIDWLKLNNLPASGLDKILGSIHSKLIVVADKKTIAAELKGLHKALSGLTPGTIRHLSRIIGNQLKDNGLKIGDNITDPSRCVQFVMDRLKTTCKDPSINERYRRVSEQSQIREHIAEELGDVYFELTGKEPTTTPEKGFDELLAIAFEIIDPTAPNEDRSRILSFVCKGRPFRRVFGGGFDIEPLILREGSSK